MIVRSRMGQPGPDSTWASTSFFILLALLATRISALTQEYCANINTGSDSSPVSNNYNSNGKCQTTCAGYAFAVVQYKNCWCSNYAPGDTTSVSSCAQNCPGYPFEQCGDQSQGLFGYVALGPSPSGTQGGSSPTSSPSQAATSQASSKPSTVTTSITPTTAATTTKSINLVSLNLNPSTTSSAASSSWTPTPVTSIETVTGQVRTMTITPTSPPAVSTQTVLASANNSPKNGFWSSPGKVAGTFVVVALVIVALLVAVIVLCIRQRRRQQHEAHADLPSTAGSGTPQRRPSRMSQMGLLGGTIGSRSGGGGSVGEKSYPTIETSDWNGGSGGGSGTVGTRGSGGSGGGGGGSGGLGEKSPSETLVRRGSFPAIVDQRLEPTAVWNPLHDNGSHVSVRSFRDDQDYSRRMLRVANPDE